MNTSGRFFFSSRRRHTRWNCDWSSDVCSSDLRIVEVRAMPLVAVTTADPREIRSGALGAELERVVVHALARQRVVAVTLGLRTQRADHLRVAVVATFADRKSVV